ncbi:TIM23 complex component [Apophysomyces ossiformis]|uniref:Presequence translocated-associated motor subunit PAM17 n=1 Tax=Apophysomyces ossiformis TaxID=679940 RepID=A0A8H7C064_9FUNG|nr:TIM23 complex component [Apophysomyces ossiformis]
MSVRAIQSIRPQLQTSLRFSRPVSLRLQAACYSTSQRNDDTSIESWNDYFKLRKKRRMYEIGSYAPCTIVPFLGTGAYFMNLEIAPTTTFFGMDPLMGSVLATTASGFVGFLVAPVVGNVFFKLFNRRMQPAMDARDRDFYEHIKRNRADARLNSIRNPIPDYYGEKIQSVTDYRSWLRKQREHYRKGVFGGNMDEF